MLHRLFHGNNHRLSEADLRSHLLLHGDNTDSIGALDEQDVRIIIAQDLGDKAKVVLLDTQKNTTEIKVTNHDCLARTSLPGLGCKKRPSFPPPKDSATTPELLTELMFGTVPLSYRGTSVRVHPLSSHDTKESRSFLFTKVFTVNISGPTPGPDSPQHDDSSAGSLSSSFGSNAGTRNEYPFPMTTITDARPKTATDRGSRERAHDRHAQMSSARTLDMSHQRQPRSVSSRHHSRAASGSNRSDLGDVAPHVPFSKSDGIHAHDDYFSGWLPSPGPVLTRRRRSTGTNGSISPGSVLGRGRYQAAMCAIGIVFTVPGTGNEHSECAVITRYWQMLTRAIYALQRIVYDEVEMALNFVTANGALQTPCSRTQISQKGEAQVYQRGKKLYVALGQNCLRHNNKVSCAVENFRARLAGGINLPEIQRNPLPQEASLLVDELSHLITQLDRKESKFIFFTLLTHLAKHGQAMKRRSDVRETCHRDILRERFVILSDNAVLARRLIYCIARLFFRGHNEHLREATDYGLVWPSSGLLHVTRKELLQKRRTGQANTSRLTRGWDIPRHGRPLSSGSHNMLPISPSIYHRPPSTTSNTSSRGSSWKPSWSWFGNGSRTNLHMDDSRSDTRTMQTSWTSADFADLVGSRKSPRSCSPIGNTSHGTPASPVSDGEVTDADEDDEDGGESIETTVPTPQLEVHKDDGGIVNVSLLRTVSLNKQSGQAESIKLDQAEAELPLTGVLTRFHPDMLLQAIPQAAHCEGELRDYLVEEDLYIQPSTTPDASQDWIPGASVTLVELGNGWRIRKLTRMTKHISCSSALTEEEEDSIGHVIAGARQKSPELTSTTYEETWHDEVLVDLSEPLRQCILDGIYKFKADSDSMHVQSMIDALFSVSL